MAAFDLHSVVDYLRSQIADLQAVYRFGSFGTTAQRTDSDLDLAFLAPKEVDSMRVWDLAQGLAAQAGLEVDLIDLRKASTVFQAQIVSSGERVYCADAATADTFEDFVYGSYVRLNEERAGILSDIRARGTVYGR